jgi:hypothetical protein
MAEFAPVVAALPGPVGAGRALGDHTFQALLAGRGVHEWALVEVGGAGLPGRPGQGELLEPGPPLAPGQ